MSICCGNSQNEESTDKPRGCTDLLCLAIFGLFWGLLIFIAAFAFVIGDPTRLAYGRDSFGNTCGMINEELGNMAFSGMDMTDKPYLFFLNMSNVHESLKICVKKCPDRMLLDEKDVVNFELKTGARLCRYDVAKLKQRSAFYPVAKNARIENYLPNAASKNSISACPVLPIHATRPIFNRCVPLPAANLASGIKRSIYAYLNSFDTIQQVVSDMYAARYEILGMAGLAFFLSFIMAFTIHYLASFVAWIIIVVVCIASIAGTCILWWTYADIKWQLNTTPFNQLLAESAQNERTFLIYSILATIFTVILLLIVLVLRKRVHVVVKLFEESGRCIRSMPLLLLQPLWTFLALVLFFVFWVGVLVALATAYYPVKTQMQNDLEVVSPSPLPVTLAKPSEHDEAVNKTFTLVSFSESPWIQCMWWYPIVALVWIIEFIFGCQQMVIAGAVASWYFSRNRSEISCPIGKSAYRLFLYHMGSVALGSFLITLFKIPRLILTYIISKIHKFQEYSCMLWCLKCCSCCIWCMEKCMRHLNHNAYTIISIQGIGFCKAAREAFDILASNALQVATINSVGDFILFLGKCGVASITTFIGILIMKSNEELHSYAIPVIIIIVFSYLMAHCVLSVYEMVIDTLFVCCCEDMLQNDGSKEKPYYGGSLICYIKGTDNAQPLQPLDDKQMTKNSLPT